MLAVRTLRAFLPAKDFALSQRFYEALGFTVSPLAPNLCELRIGVHAAFLQDYYVREWAENCMMQLLLDDLDATWDHVQAADLPARFGVQPPRPPAMQPWGLRVAFIFDPSGVLWHFSELRPASLGVG